MSETRVYGYLLTLRWGTILIKGLETTGLKIKPNFEPVLVKDQNGVEVDDFVDFDTDLSISGKSVERSPDDRPKKEIDTLTVTGAATASANVTITLNGAAVLIAVLNADSASVVAGKIRAETYAGWTTGGATDVVIFTKILTGPVSAPVFGAGTTGVVAAFVRTIIGQNSLSEDYETLREACAVGAEIAFVYGRFVTGEKIVSGTITMRDWSEDAGSEKKMASWSGSAKAKKGTVIFTTF